MNDKDPQYLQDTETLAKIAGMMSSFDEAALHRVLAGLPTESPAVAELMRKCVMCARILREATEKYHAVMKAMEAARGVKSFSA
jgi:hypothetical protein